ncbi:MAG: DNA polymerase III subunit delta [Desulfovibrio sp.]|jgi:DNA polymerase-3 subunit delta|nr:DNA polymerase III subunit delta [Desulfovibrio sp.]
MSRPAFTICICPDSRLLRKRLDALLAMHAPVQDGGWRRTVFWGDEGLGASFWQELTLRTLFALPKALVLRKAETLPADTLEKQLSPALLACLGQNSQATNTLTWPIICLENEFDRERPKIPAHIQRLPFYRKAEELGFMDVSPPLSGKRISDYIRSEAARLGIKLENREIFLLGESLPPDASMISAEMEKLALSRDAGGKPSREALALAGDGQSPNNFELLRLFQRQGKSLEVWKRIFKDRVTGKNQVFAFLALLLREARILRQCLKDPEPTMRETDLRQKTQVAQKLGEERIASLWDIALRADRGIKSGERDVDQAMDMLAADLFTLFGEEGKSRPKFDKA